MIINHQKAILLRNHTPIPDTPQKKIQKTNSGDPEALLQYDIGSKKTHMTKLFEGRILIKAQFSILVVVVQKWLWLHCKT